MVIHKKIKDNSLIYDNNLLKLIGDSNEVITKMSYYEVDNKIDKLKNYISDKLFKLIKTCIVITDMRLRLKKNQKNGTYYLKYYGSGNCGDVLGKFSVYKFKKLIDREEYYYRYKLILGYDVEIGNGNELVRDIGEHKNVKLWQCV